MATLSRNFTLLPEPVPVFLSPQNPSKILKLSPSRIHSFEPRGTIRISGTRIRAVRREESTLLDERERELETRLNRSVNGNGSGNSAYGNGSARSYANGSAKVEKENENFVKYVNGNVAAKSGLEVVKTDKVIGGKNKTVEEIGQEDAWFKRNEQDQVEVSVAPGGRWNRFKTYSTIQRTLEIWGFVLSFVFKAWLSNQKFSYRG